MEYPQAAISGRKVRPGSGAQWWGGKGFGIGALGISSGCYQWKVRPSSGAQWWGGKGFGIGALGISSGCYQWKVRPGSGAQSGRERLWHRSSWNILRLLSVESKTRFWCTVGEGKALA